MKIPLIVTLLILSIAVVLSGQDQLSAKESRTPVLVELFTSEGCSSCPPADRLLEQLDRQPTAEAELIVLSEHVDYWNQLGWKDPYSAHFYSDRQNAYARRFGLDSVYTPQMVIDGTSQFVGSDARLAERMIEKLSRTPKIEIRLAPVSVDGRGVLHAHVDTGVLTPSFGLPEADLYVAIALNQAESQVRAGENGGHRLTHASVVRDLSKVAALKQGHNLAQDFEVQLEPHLKLNNVRVIMFLQAPRQGPIVGATLMRSIHEL